MTHQWVGQKDWEYDEKTGQVHDCEGNLLFIGMNLNVDIIGKIIGVANIAYRDGYAHGQRDKQSEIKRALGINP